MIARLVVVAAAAALLLPSLASGAGPSDEQALAKRFAPVVELVAQAHECGNGESYDPIDVDALFGQPTVALRGPWGESDLVKIAPVGADLTAARYEYHLDFPGNPLDPGCSYERWGRRITEGTSPTVYAHVARDAGYPGKLALQYWFFYVFNDWNNTHEGDWEMIQLDFDAATPAEALSRTPTSVGYSQHEGAERAAWDDPKLDLVGGTHPVVHPAAGSHANFYGEALYLGRSASEGVGCDDTRGPTLELRPVVDTIPSDPAAARRAFPWIEFAGRWGELQPAFFNGPTGPNLKEQWTEPIRWSAELARPERRGAGWGCARDVGHRLLLRRRRSGLERAAPEPRAPAARARRARRAGRADRLGVDPDGLGARRPAAPRAPARVGADARRLGTDLRRAPLALPRHRRPGVAGLGRGDAPPVAGSSTSRASSASRRRAKAKGRWSSAWSRSAPRSPCSGSGS